MKVFFIFLLLLTACQTTPEGKKADSYRQENYLPIVEQFTNKDRQYEGLHNNFEYKATLLNYEVLDTQTQLKSLYYQWSEPQYRENWQKIQSATFATTQVFISFYSPSSEIENLTNKKSPWAIYLEAGGKRYQGVVTDNRDLRTELTKYYPYHNRWSKAFTLTFQVPLAEIEKQPSRLVITGPIGTSTSNFSETTRATK